MFLSRNILFFFAIAALPLYIYNGLVYYTYLYLRRLKPPRYMKNMLHIHIWYCFDSRVWFRRKHILYIRLIRLNKCDLFLFLYVDVLNLCAIIYLRYLMVKNYSKLMFLHI